MHVDKQRSCAYQAASFFGNNNSVRKLMAKTIARLGNMLPALLVDVT